MIGPRVGFRNRDRTEKIGFGGQVFSLLCLEQAKIVVVIGQLWMIQPLNLLADFKDLLNDPLGMSVEAAPAIGVGELLYLAKRFDVELGPLLRSQRIGRCQTREGTRRDERPWK